MGCAGTTKYSEQLIIQSSSTVTLDEDQPDYIPTEAAVFDEIIFSSTPFKSIKTGWIEFFLVAISRQ